jgi:branched-chain amino acid transport system substrate-binding protein
MGGEKKMRNKRFNFMVLFLTNIILIGGLSLATLAEVTVGSLSAQSGHLSKVSQIMAEAQQVVVDHINKDGIGIAGEGLLEIQSANTMCHPERSLAVATLLIKKFSPEVVIGPTCSVTAERVAKLVTVPQDVLLISPSASAPEISFLNDKDLVFRTVPSDAQQIHTLIKYLLSKDVREVLILYETDPYNQTLSQIFLQEFTDQGGTVLYKQRLSAETFIDQVFIDAFIDTAALADQPALVLIAHGNTETVELFQRFLLTVHAKQQEVGEGKIFSHLYGTDSMFTDEIKSFIGTVATALVIPYNMNKEITILTQVTSQNSPEYESYAFMMQLAGLNPHSPYAATSFDTTMLVALALQHHRIVLNENTALETEISLSDSLRWVASPPGYKIYPGDWDLAVKMLLAGMDIDYEGASGSLNFDQHGDVTGMYALNQVSPNNTWIVNPIGNP